MSDDLLIGGGIAAAYALVNRLLGPSIDVLGKDAADVIERRLNILAGISRKEERRCRELARELTDDEVLHPRLVARLVAEGSFLDDEVMQEYMAGLLLGARSVQPVDTKLYFARMITDMPALHIAVHHVVYSALLGVGNDGGHRRFGDRMEQCAVEITEEQIRAALPDVDYAEIPWALVALQRGGLITNYRAGLAAYSNGWIEYDGFVVLPALTGIELLYTAYCRESMIRWQ